MLEGEGAPGSDVSPVFQDGPGYSLLGPLGWDSHYRR